MPDLVDQVSCAECATSYDSDLNAFCPRCGSTDRSKAVPGALPVAARHDPRRRRVQASGVLLLVSGTLFLVFAVLGLAMPRAELAAQFVEPMADQPGGTLLLVPPANVSFNATITTLAGGPLGNASEHVGVFEFTSPDHASLRIAWTLDGQSYNTTAIILAGDTLRLPLDAPVAEVVLGPSLKSTFAVVNVVFVIAAAVMVAGGLSALLLRLWPLAAAAAIFGLILGLIVVAGFLLAGLLFAIPFAAAALFILRGRHHFQRAKA